MRDGLCLFLDDLMSAFGMFKSRHSLCPYLDIRCPRHATRALENTQEDYLGDTADPQQGYLDDIFDVFDAHQHPCIVMGRSALLWMGAGVLPSDVSVNIVKYRIAG